MHRIVSQTLSEIFFYIKSIYILTTNTTIIKKILKQFIPETK